MAAMKIFRLLAVAVPLLLSGCAAELPSAPPAAPADTGMAWYQQAIKAGKKIYRIDAAQSLITITVRRGGALARLGHDHVVASRTLAGFVAPDAGRADFHFRLDQMSVDEAPLRAAAGLDTQPSTDAIAGTRTNMLTRVLDAARFPLVLLHAERLDGAGKVRLSVTLHGVTRRVDVPTTIERNTGMLTASGELRLLQSDFGITPMSVMGGAMTVQDPMELAFRIVATPAR
jgi:hypothetical protein